MKPWSYIWMVSTDMFLCFILGLGDLELMLVDAFEADTLERCWEVHLLLFHVDRECEWNLARCMGAIQANQAAVARVDSWNATVTEGSCTACGSGLYNFFAIFECLSCSNNGWHRAAAVLSRRQSNPNREGAKGGRGL